MKRELFNHKWTFGVATNFHNMRSRSTEVVTLPHDAMIVKARDPKVSTGEKKAYFPDGSYEYTNTFFVPAEYKNKRITFEFEGVYANAMVYINDDYAGQHPYGYSHFYIKADRYLKYGQENEIKVVTRSHDDSRWYSGAGIYRNASMIIANPVHVALDGLKINTHDINSKRAILTVSTKIDNEAMNPQTMKIVTEILNDTGDIVAADSSTFTAFTQETNNLLQRLYVQEPKLWNVNTPYLYTARVKLLDGDQVLDEESTTFGIRTLSLDAVDGLQINGEVVKLRGACIHHDNGIIGAATIDRAEERRVQILKEAGFNALRSSHHPMSKSMLAACDRIGMLVMDESFDMWTRSKTPYDYALNFPLWWEKDIEAMVNKDYNHPSVILYSIGNEIQETGTSNGAAWGRKLAEKIRELDNSRYILNSINGMLSVMRQVIEMSKGRMDGNFNANLGGDAATAMKRVVTSSLVTNATEESFAAVDIAGLNYGDARYVMDKELYPNRVICGSETFPRDIPDNWKLVKENGHIIGDFVWTGWDYLGEAGIGKVTYADEEDNQKSMIGEYPWISAYCGDIDLIGNRRPSSYFREIVFGLRKEPYITVLRPSKYGIDSTRSAWSLSDSVSSWSWHGYEGKTVEIEVYADSEEIELLINGNSIGKAGAGEPNQFKAVFEAVYEPGEIIAVAYENGIEVARTSLKSANDVLNLQVEADRSTLDANTTDLSFINVSFVDDQGILLPLADRKVKVTIYGPGYLQGFGSGNPKSEVSYLEPVQSTFDGKALAVIRPMDQGLITVTFEADGCISQTIELHVHDHEVK